MGFNFASKAKNEGWGRMGFLLVFFPEESQNHHHEMCSNKKKSPNLNRASSIHYFLLHNKAQYTISISLLLLFTAALFFILTTLPSSSAGVGSGAAAARRLYSVPRRQFPSSCSNPTHALQGVGVLYRRGIRAMNDLIVAHVTESATQHELRMFVRLFYRSSLASRSDIVFLFRTRSPAFDEVILQENVAFLKLLSRYGKKSGNGTSRPTPSFDVTHFIKLSRREKERGEPIWGRRRIRSNFSEPGGGESTRLSYGSVLAFDAEELDPENSLSGFLDHVPLSLRRWACYPMLLGRVRRNFKHALLVDIKDILLLGDPLSRVRTHRPESVLLIASNGRKTHPIHSKPVNSGIIMGGLRGIRRLSNEMLMNIVRASMQQQQQRTRAKKKRNSFTESGLFNQLVTNEYALKKVNLVVSTESVPEAASWVLQSGPHLLMKNHSMIIRRGNSNFGIDFDTDSVIMKHICSFPEDSTVYSGC